MLRCDICLPMFWIVSMEDPAYSMMMMLKLDGKSNF